MNASLFLKNATIFTMNKKREVMRNGFIVISNDRIIAVGNNNELLTKFNEVEITDICGKVILPGFINCHTHISLSLQKGITLSVPEGL